MTRFCGDRSDCVLPTAAHRSRPDPSGARVPTGGRGRRSILLGGALCAAWLSASMPATATAESVVQLPQLEGPPDLAATTFDPDGRAVGHSRFAIERLAEGLRKLTVELGIDGGGRNRSEVTLAPVSAPPPGGSSAGGGLRIVEERSQSTRADGSRLDLLVIDHIAGRASCIPDHGGPAKARHVDLPDKDRVVNVPMQLLFQPLVKGEVEEVRFQIVLCTGGPRLQDMIAVRGPRRQHEGREVLEIRYGPDFGSTVAFFASRVLPSFSFWFDAKDGAYLGHRMPLHSKGPEVLLVRSGLTPKDLGLE